MDQQNFCDQLNVFKDQVWHHWEKKPILLLDNAPWKERQPSEVNEPCSDKLPLVIVQDKGKETEEATTSETATYCSEKLEPSLDIPSSSLVMQTLEELKKENAVIKEILDKQDDTCKEIKGMLGKQEESNT